MTATAIVETTVGEPAVARPTRLLPRWQLIELSLYWLGINVLMGGIDVPPALVGRTCDSDSRPAGCCQQLNERAVVTREGLGAAC